MNCPVCGSENPDDGVFCDICSMPLSTHDPAATEGDPFAPLMHKSPSDWYGVAEEIQAETEPPEYPGEETGPVSPPGADVPGAAPVGCAQAAETGRASVGVAPAVARSFTEVLKAYAPFIAIAAAGALYLRATAEILVRLFPGKHMSGGFGGVVTITDALSPLAIMLGIAMVLACGFAAGFLAGRYYRARGMMAGAIAGAGITVVEAALSLARAGSIARLSRFATGGATLNWGYVFMLLLVMVLVGGFGGWSGSGLGLQRANYSGMRPAILLAAGVLVAALAGLTILGAGIQATKKLPADKVFRSLKYMDYSEGWNAEAIYVAPVTAKEKSLAGVQYNGEIGYKATLKEPHAVHFATVSGEGYVKGEGERWTEEEPVRANITADSDKMSIKITGKWAGNWDGKEVVCEEFEGKASDYPFIETLVRRIRGVSLAGGAALPVKGIVWRSMKLEGVSCITFLLYKDSDTEAGSGGMINFEFSKLNSPTLEYSPVSTRIRRAY